MCEVSGSVKQFLIAVNQQFPGGALFLLVSDYEFRKLMMEMTQEMMESGQSGQLYARRLIGRNQSSFWKVPTPLDEGQCLMEFCLAIQ